MRTFDKDLQKDVTHLALVAEADNFALQNATPTILSYTVPNDGRYHTVFVVGTQVVTSAETGGAVGMAVTDNASGKSNPGITLWNAASPAGLFQMSGQQPYILSPGSTVVVSQSSALTLGASTVSLRVYSD